jgi:glycosyltransferase involved in cell wall biosynthesis
MIKKLNIIKVIDVFGWAYYFTNKEMQKYSKHNIIIQKYNEVKLTKDIDLIYFPSPSVYGNLTGEVIPKQAHNMGIKVVGAYSGENLLKSVYKHYDAIVGISPQITEACKQIYPEDKCYFLQEGIDTNFFKVDRNYNNFQVGWIGSKFPVKRIHLLDKLKYKVKIQSNHGDNYFKDGRTSDESYNFYKSIDCLVLCSSSEAMPRSILEACSMGLPCVSSDVGSCNLLLDKECLIQPNPEDKFINTMNSKLDLLYKDKELRKLIGERNRKHIQEHHSWDVLIKQWDEFFERIVGC